MTTKEPGREFTELGQFTLDAAAIRLLPRAFCARQQVVVLDAARDAPEAAVLIGAVAPGDRLGLHRVADLLQRPVEAVRLNAYEIERALAFAWDRPQADNDRHVLDPRHVGRRRSIPQRLDGILLDALAAGASDIHFEHYRVDVDVRLRIDGILHQVQTDLNPRNAVRLVNRVKVLADLDITEHRLPQDGRFSCTVLDTDPPRDIDFRVSVIPGPDGEDVVIRVLDAGTGMLPFAALGLDDEDAARLAGLLVNPEGLVLVTGPTGSGKTTTLYAALARINDGRRKIVTAEDPIEYLLPKVNQKRVDGPLNMPLLLRALLRHDPDVMLVGEIRDRETGTTALAAAVTGHLVLSTLHTPDALGAVSRLRGLELDDLEIASALLAVLAQRLARRVCPECVAPDTPTEAQRRLFGALLDGRDFVAGHGCPACRHTGYRGRVGLYELLLVDPELQALIAERAHGVALHDHVRARGHRTLVDDALAKATSGATSLDELARVLPYRQVVAAREAHAPGRRRGSGRG